MTATLTDPRSLRGAPYRHKRTAVELPTLALIFLMYGAWLGITAAYGHLTLWIIAPAVTLLLTLHSSVQHEIIHGHPTRRRSINRVLGMPPLSFWLPFERYRELHLTHHSDERLTDPLDDPESYYWTPAEFSRMRRTQRMFLQIQQTLAGRLVIGSVWRVVVFLRSELHRVIRNQDGVRRAWVEHLLWCVPVILWLTLVCRMPLWVYVAAMIVPANGIALFRSFAEHRALPDPRMRTAIVEGAYILGPLFLFNNLHALHHESPSIPWYEYNARYRVERARLVAQNGGLVYSTYFDVARRFLFRPYDALEHPLGRVPRARRAAT